MNDFPCQCFSSEQRVSEVASHPLPCHTGLITPLRNELYLRRSIRVSGGLMAFLR